MCTLIAPNSNVQELLRKCSAFLLTKIMWIVIFPFNLALYWVRIDRLSFVKLDGAN